MFLRILLVSLCISICASESIEAEQSNTDWISDDSDMNKDSVLPPMDMEFPSTIDWTDFDDAFNLAKDSNKPLMLIVHKSYCTACGILKKSFSDHESEIVEASKDFIMVKNKDDTFEPEADDDRYAPDGQYIPRVLFYDPNGNLLREMMNEQPEYKPQFMYFHSNVSTIINSMNRVKEFLALRNSEEPFEFDDESASNKVEL